MTGFKVRVFRVDHFEELDIDELNDAELQTVPQRLSGEGGWRWAIALAKWIRDNVRESPDPRAQAAAGADLADMIEAPTPPDDE